ncbi:MAG: DUF115 domain-containing protein [Nitrosopumilus sp.]|nr:DUF115 domain-containing protein [Nitrosopumilus sp.]
MRFIDWYPYYLKISSNLHLDIKKDILSSLILSNLIPNESSDLKCLKKLNNKKILIIGAGPSIEDPLIQKFISDRSNFVIMTSDGSTELCLQLNIIPDFVVTDLDGDIDSLLSANKFGSKLLIHAHGNNIDKILKFAPRFKNFFGTTQVFPLQNVYNFGGFTDGDRCVFLAEGYRCAEIWLVGMDFNSPIGYFSKKRGIYNPSLKRKKLFIGKNLIEMLAKKSDSIMINVTTFKLNSLINGAIEYKLK